MKSLNIFSNVKKVISQGLRWHGLVENSEVEKFDTCQSYYAPSINEIIFEIYNYVSFGILQYDPT